MKFLKFLPKIVKAIKILVGAYRAGEEAGVWTEKPGYIGESRDFDRPATLTDHKILDAK